MLYKEDIYRFLEKSSWNHIDGCMEPLITVDEGIGTVKVSMDLPCVKKDDIELIVTENSLEVKAKLSQKYTFNRWGVVQKGINFKSFHKTMQFPFRIDTEKVASKFAHGILEIQISKKQEKKHIRID